MITNYDRAKWFGASDTSFIVGNFQTATFKKWWLEKLGLRVSHLNTKAMKTGTEYEHRVLNTIPDIMMDRQIIIPELHLRVNLDGETEIIHECKTYKADVFKITKAYRQQVCVQMFAAKKKAEIVSYRLTDADYKNYFTPIDKSRIGHHPIEYDDDFIALWLDRIEYLGDCLEKGIMPK